MILFSDKAPYDVIHQFKPADASLSSAQLEGKVIEEDSDEPLIGVAIRVANTTIGTSSDINGNFTLTVPLSKIEDQIIPLECSYIGYQRAHLKIPFNHQQFRVVMSDYANNNGQRNTNTIVIAPKP